VILKKKLKGKRKTLFKAEFFYVAFASFFLNLRTQKHNFFFSKFYCYLYELLFNDFIAKIENFSVIFMYYL